ncbi:MAG: erythromycin esterase family protein [bacterium]
MSRSTAIRTLMFVVSSALFCRNAPAQASHDASDRAAFVAWARKTAIPIGSFDERDSRLDPARVGSFTRDTRVVGIGESVHGTHELMLLKSRMTEQLILHGRVSAVVLESGLAEGRVIDAWVTRQTDSTPDFARSLSYGWGQQSETIAALRQLREHNARVPVARRVHFYGMDLPANGGGSLLPALAPVWSYLDDVDPAFAAESRARLMPIATMLASEGYGIVDKYAAAGAARDTLRVQLDALVQRFRANERAYASRAPSDRYAWALRLAEVARQTEVAVRIGWNDASNPRDSAMAENVGWIVAREHARGVVVVWAHDLHVGRVPIGGPIFASRGGAPSVTSMGERLARSFGRAYVPIGTAFRRHTADSAFVLDSASADDALARVDIPRYLLDLTRAPHQGPVARWLQATRLKRAEDGYVATSVGRAYDAIVYVDSIGPSRAGGAQGTCCDLP